MLIHVTGKELEESGACLIGVVPEFVWRDRGKPRTISVRIAPPEYKSEILLLLLTDYIDYIFLQSKWQRQHMLTYLRDVW
jgi:hypothetical protein